MDGGLIGAIVSVTVAVVGGPYAWSAMREWMRTRASDRDADRAQRRADRADVDDAEARLLTRLEQRVSHLEDENAKLHAENRELQQMLDAKTREVDGVRAAYSMLSEQHALLVERVGALENTIETLNAANAKAIERAIASALVKRDLT